MKLKTGKFKSFVLKTPNATHTLVDLDADYCRGGPFQIWRQTGTSCTRRCDPFEEWAYALGDLRPPAPRWLLLTANYRTLRNDEIVLDVDPPTGKDRHAVLYNILWKLCGDKFSGEIFDSGGRGWHVHLLFPELTTLSGEERKNARRWFSIQYGCDPAQASNGTGIPGRPHRKTGKIKTLALRFYNGDNTLPPACKSYVRTQTRRTTTRATRGLGSQTLTPLTGTIHNHPLVRWMLNNKIPKGKRHSVWLRELAKLTLRYQLDDETVNVLAKELRPSMPDKHDIQQELTGWRKWLTKKEGGTA